MQFEDNRPAVSLSASQQQAIESESRAIVVLASAGSGKTEVVARRVQRLLASQNGVGRVLALSYTNKAAEELRDRLRSHAGAESERVTTETIHGFAHSLIRQHSTRIGLPIDPEILTRDEDRVELLNQWRSSQGLGDQTDPIGQLRRIDLDRARTIETPEIEDWRRALLSLPALDYPALLDTAFEILGLKSVSRLLQRTYTHVVVDEAQNLTPSQYRLLEALFGTQNNGPSMMLVGDVKQSIISFAGADPELVRHFARSYQAEVVELTENFRSSGKLSQLAGLIAGELGQHHTQAEAHAAAGQIEIIEGIDESDEARKIADSIQGLIQNGLPANAVAEGESVNMRAEDIAILGRSASALRAVADELETRDIPYSTNIDAEDWLEGLVGKIVLEIIAINAAEQHLSPQWHLARLIDRSLETLKTRDQVRDAISSHPNLLIAALAPLMEEKDLGAFISKLITLFDNTDAINSELASWNTDLSEIEHAWSDYRATVDRDGQSWAGFRIFCSRRQRGSATQGVQLLTIHKSQGREFRAVVLVGMNEGQIPDFRAKSKAEHDSELRTFYVAVTRPRRVLMLSRARYRSTRFGQRATNPSPYLMLAQQVMNS